MRNVLYLIEQSLDQRNEERFGIKEWCYAGWRVEVWDVSLITQPHRSRINIPQATVTLDNFRHRRVQSLSELFGLINKCPKNLLYVDLTGSAIPILLGKVYLRIKCAKRIVCNLGVLPTPQVELGSASVFDKVAFAVKSRRGMGVLVAIFRRLMLCLTRSNWTVVAGTASLTMVGVARGVIRAHNFDYDVFLRLRHEILPKPKPYLVFIDQAYCSHPDFQSEGRQPPATPEVYFSLINHYLNLLGHSLGCEVVIAAHPRSREHAYSPDFKVFHGQTGTLIKESELVVCHDSTAVQFAVLFEKPIVFVTTDELARVYEGRSIREVASQLGQTPVNLNDTYSIVVPDDFREINRDLYSGYVSKYIKWPGSPDEPLWNIVIGAVSTKCISHSS